MCCENRIRDGQQVVPERGGAGPAADAGAPWEKRQRGWESHGRIGPRRRGLQSARRSDQSRAVLPETTFMTDPISLTRVRYPPRPFDDRHATESGRGGSRLAGAVLGLIWLPAGYCLAFAAGGGTPVPLELAVWPDLVMLAPAGLMLALPVGALRRRGRARTAWRLAAVLALLTAAGCAQVVTLGPLAVAICAAAGSLPAWVALAFLRRRAGRSNRIRFAR